jgi:hypothetical protein
MSSYIEHIAPHAIVDAREFGIDGGVTASGYRPLAWMAADPASVTAATIPLTLIHVCATRRLR